MMKNYFLAILLLLSATCIHGQLASTITASVSADIIIPVGTEKSGEIMIAGNFYAGKESGIVKLTSNNIFVNDRANVKDPKGKTESPSFHVICDQHVYAITLSYDPLIITPGSVQETMQLESVTLLPVTKKKSGELISDTYSIAATVRVGPYQAPGKYIANNPCIVTVNFN